METEQKKETRALEVCRPVFDTLTVGQDEDWYPCARHRRSEDTFEN